MRKTMLAVSFLLTIIGAIIESTRATISYKVNQFQTRNFEEKFSVLIPKNLITSHKFDVQTNDACSRDIDILGDAYAQGETWALKLLDASSKIPSGMMEGNLMDFGALDECINVKGESQGIEIRGHHCMYSSAWTAGNTTLTLSLSICVPRTCNSTHIIHLSNNKISAVDKMKDLVVTSATCAVTDNEIWDSKLIATISFLTLFIALLLFCTLIDIILQRRSALEYRQSVLTTLAKFSLIKSASSILSTHVGEGTMSSLHGIRFISACLIILGHEYLLHFYLVDSTSINVFNWFQTWSSVFIFVTTFAVDTFLTISGFLMTYIFLKKQARTKNFNLPLYYLDRYLRLTPAILGLTIFVTILLSKIGSGPRWDSTMKIVEESFRKEWWQYILYVQNLANKKISEFYVHCSVHLWYLAVEMQLFWVSPIILYPLRKNEKLGLFIWFVFLLASIVIPGANAVINKYRALPFLDIKTKRFMPHVFMNFYTMTYNRTGPWLIGIMLGYKVAKDNQSPAKFAVFTGWLVAIGAFSYCIFGIRSSLTLDYEYKIIWETMYLAISKHVWAVGICWVIYACLHNHAGPISYILSSKIFFPLSKISYSIYLVHFYVIIVRISLLRTPYYFCDYFMIRDFITDLAICIVIGFFWSLFFEGPFLVLRKIIFRRKDYNTEELQRNCIQNHTKEE